MDEEGRLSVVVDERYERKLRTPVPGVGFTKAKVQDGEKKERAYDALLAILELMSLEVSLA